MASTHSRAEITSADTKQLGFEYQYLYFIVKLLQMRYGDEVGYEARDDIHVVSASSGDTLYIQVKHTTGLSADGAPANLTNLSEDLWKTLSNWSKLITDSAEQRDTASAQKAFIQKSKFIFATNRNTCQNDISNLVAAVKGKAISATLVRTKIQAILDPEFSIDDEITISHGGKGVKKNTRLSFRYFLMMNTLSKDIVDNGKMFFDKMTIERYRDVWPQIFDLSFSVITPETLAVQKQIPRCLRS